MRLLGLKSVVQFGRWLRSRFKRGGLILGYHRVADPLASAYDMCVSPAHFAEQLEVIRRCCQPLSLTELVNQLDDGSLPARAVALTFDDGYADVLVHALPRLQHHTIPATVFVVTGCLGQAFWWDELAHALLRVKPPGGQLRLQISGEAVSWMLDYSSATRDDQPGNIRRLVAEIYRRLLPLAPAERNSVLSQIRKWSGNSPAESASSRSLTAAEVRQLASAQIEIGTHTVTHPVLAALPISFQRSEIQGSKDALEDLLGRPIAGFSYPNGSTSPTTQALVQEAGFGHACGSQPDVALRSSHRHALPRFWVPDCDGDSFARWLGVWQRG
jgi:peptidoglycan/xylan/chitin deacetylase (PgdA/CDA1 family)